MHMLQSSEFSSTWMVVLKVAVVVNFHSHFEAIHWSFWTVFLHTNFLGFAVKASTVVGSCVTRIPHLIKSYDFHWEPFQAYFAVCPKTSVIRLHILVFAEKLCDSFTQDAFVVWINESVGGRVALCSARTILVSHCSQNWFQLPCLEPLEALCWPKCFVGQSLSMSTHFGDHHTKQSSSVRVSDLVSKNTKTKFHLSFNLRTRKYFVFFYDPCTKDTAHCD